MQAISKNQIKFIRSLSQQKFRKEHSCYIVEGVKNAEEWIMQGADIAWLVALPEWLQSNAAFTQHLPLDKILIATDIDFEKISGFKTPNQVLLVVNIPTLSIPQEFKPSSWSLILDKVQDPGNLGTIIRTADWFGIQNIICSVDTVEQFNPKVIQSTMGSLLRVHCHYTNLPVFLDQYNQIPSYAAVLGGSDIKRVNNTTSGFIVMGNESKGISTDVLAKVTHKITIPKIGNAESLNVGVATGICCYALMG